MVSVYQNWKHHSIFPWSSKDTHSFLRNICKKSFINLLVLLYIFYIKYLKVFKACSLKYFAAPDKGHPHCLASTFRRSMLWNSQFDVMEIELRIKDISLKDRQSGCLFLWSGLVWFDILHTFLSISVANVCYCTELTTYGSLCCLTVLQLLDNKNNIIYNL